MSQKKQKLAVLGGGLGSLAAVFELTSDPQWRATHEVTVYQMGWRLGGKGASGRDLDRGARNEEHGIHMWMGFYARAFRMLEACYGEMEVEPDNPLPTVDKAFIGQQRAAFTEYRDDPPWTWNVEFPIVEGRPADGDDNVSLWDMIEVALAWLRELLDSRTRKFRWLRWLIRLLPIRGALKYLSHLDPKPLEDLHAHVQQIQQQHKAQAEAIEDLDKLLDVADELAHVASVLSELLHGKTSKRAQHARELKYLLEVAAAVVRGIIADRVWLEGYQVIDHLDFTDWLKSHGASHESASCAPIRSLYDAMFAYVDGDAARPSVAAGIMLHSCLLTFFGYRGCMYYQMQAGMGDVVFAPLYKVLKQRGVRFEFFTNVLELELNTAGDAVEAIRIGRQAEVQAGAQNYAPLITVKGLPCWPAKPLYDQLNNPNTKVNYEIPDVVGSEETLIKGSDFDKVLLGIPIGAHPMVCKQLIARKPEWQAMVDNLGTVATLGAQFWFNRSWSALGGDNAVVGSALPSYLSIRANSTAVIAQEDWPVENSPQALVYLCNNFLVPDAITMPVLDQDQWRVAHAAVQDLSRDWLEKNASLIWKNADPDGGKGLDPDYLYGSGPEAERMDEQFFKPNVTPSELYVQSTPGSAQYRLKADQSGCANLVLTGDWINNGFLNAGCIEATASAGLEAAAAMRNLDG